VSDGKGDTRCGTETAREQYRREDLLYASDMTDAERALISPHPPGKKALGRPRVVPLRGVIDAPRFSEALDLAALLLCLAGQRVMGKVNFLLVQQARERDGRKANPSAEVSVGQDQGKRRSMRV
jgi:hypothetical protein